MVFKKIYILYGILAVCLILLLFSGTIMSQVNEPKYTVLRSDDEFEIREYDPNIVAQVQINGERKEAISDGFRILADFIFGKNTVQQKINMTAPVSQQSGEKIEMTAPVIQQGVDESGIWNIRFVMPEEYTMNTLPVPLDDRIKVLEIPRTRYAVIKFSGVASDINLEKHLGRLLKYMKAGNYHYIGEPILAFYNPPWTLSFLRRNEIMFELQQ